MLGELCNCILDEFNDIASESHEKRNKQILGNAWRMASAQATIGGWNSMLNAIAAPAPGF